MHIRVVVEYKYRYNWFFNPYENGKRRNNIQPKWLQCLYKRNAFEQILRERIIVNNVIF